MPSNLNILYSILSMISGILNSNEELYEAAAIDGIKNRFQEMIYITIPQMKPQMLFAAVMSIVNAFQNGMISTWLTGNPSPGYAAQLIVNHIEDYGFLRYGICSSGFSCIAVDRTVVLKSM